MSDGTHKRLLKHLVEDVPDHRDLARRLGIDVQTLLYALAGAANLPAPAFVKALDLVVELANEKVRFQLRPRPPDVGDDAAAVGRARPDAGQMEPPDA